MGVCHSCGTAQTIISPQWEAEARAIYDAYTIYHQSEGAEQTVFNPATGEPATRSATLLQRLTREISFPERARLLDIGCGNGATLRAFSEIAPGWSLAGLEVNEHYKDVVESIPGVEALYTEPIASVPGEFNVITLIHALEHIAQPRPLLEQLRAMFSAGGLLVVQVPDCRQNPFMFTVADHATHFFETSLRQLIARSGYEIMVVADNWIAKELTLVARRSEQEFPSTPAIDVNRAVVEVNDRVQWLQALGDEVRNLAAKEPIGVFGTSIAATWMDQELSGKIAFFVDEDPNRLGKMFMGRKILSPTQVPAGSQVVLALPSQMANQVRIRLDRQAPSVRWYVPPPLP